MAAVLLLSNWRGLHGALLRALRKRYAFLGYLIYLVLLLSGLASLFKPIVFWRLPDWGGLVPAAGLLRISATVDAVAFIFEYLFGVYIQVYLITVCFAWIKGLSFEEGELFRFAMRRFSYVLEWAGIVVVLSTLFVRVPLLLAYFTNIPDVLDYLPFQRVIMSGLIIAFARSRFRSLCITRICVRLFERMASFMAGNMPVFLLVSAHLRISLFLYHDV